jgi:hypothetical protein
MSGWGRSAVVALRPCFFVRVRLIGARVRSGDHERWLPWAI